MHRKMKANPPLARIINSGNDSFQLWNRDMDSVAEKVFTSL
jgi:hypothetical protein